MEARRPWASAQAPRERTEGLAWPGAAPAARAAPSHANPHSPKDADASRHCCHEAVRNDRAARVAAEQGLPPGPRPGCPSRTAPCHQSRGAGAAWGPRPPARGLSLTRHTCHTASACRHCPPALPSPRTASRAPASTHPSPPRTLFAGYVKPREECLSKHRFLFKHVNNCRIWFEGMFYYNGC